MNIKDQIRAEIERRIRSIESCPFIEAEVGAYDKREGKLMAYRDLLSFLDSLPEQPVEGLDVTDFCNPVDPGIAKCVADHWWKLLDDENAADKKAVKEIVKTVHKEVTRQVKEIVDKQPVEGLEEAAMEYAEKHGFRVPYDGSNNFYDDLDVKASKEGFIAGAEWQKKLDDLETADLLAIAHLQGMEQQKAKMMEEAVEGRIGQVGFHNSIYIKEPEWCDALDKFNNGDKVRVIVINED